MTDRLQDLEEQLAHLTRLAEDLSDVVARQEAEIDTLKRQTLLLLEREAAREAETGTVPLADKPPPHW